MVFRGLTFSLLLLGVVIGRLVCPCAPEPARASQQAHSAHACCEKAEKDTAPSPACPEHGAGCGHCQTLLAPADRVVEAPAPAIPPLLASFVVELLPPNPVRLAEVDSVPVDPAPPSRLSLYCILLT